MPPGAARRVPTAAARRGETIESAAVTPPSRAGPPLPESRAGFPPETGAGRARGSPLRPPLPTALQLFPFKNSFLPIELPTRLNLWREMF